MFYFGDGYFSEERRIGQRTIYTEEGRLYKKIFRLDFAPDELFYHSGKYTLRDSGHSFTFAGDPDFNFWYWFPELEGLAGGTSWYQQKKSGRWKKAAAALAALGIGALFLAPAAPAYLAPHTSVTNNGNSSEPINELAACQSNLTYVYKEKAFCTDELSACQEMSARLLQQVENQSALFEKQSEENAECQAELLDAKTELAATKAQLAAADEDLVDCENDYANLSAKVKRIWEIAAP